MYWSPAILDSPSMAISVGLVVKRERMFLLTPPKHLINGSPHSVPGSTTTKVQTHRCGLPYATTNSLNQFFGTFPIPMVSLFQ